MEGRRHKRRNIQIGCWILGQDGVSSCCSSFDISDSGIAICIDDPLPIGRIVTLQFYTPTSAAALTVPAEVVWSRTEPDGAMGLRFNGITLDQLELLRDLARHLKLRDRIRREFPC